MVGVGKLINSVDLYILLDLVGVGDWKVPSVVSLGGMSGSTAMVCAKTVPSL